jgi:hypothetical protein
MREITTEVFGFDELTETAQERAVEAVRERLAAGWDDVDIEAMRFAIATKLSEVLKSPGWEENETTAGVTVAGFDADRGQALAVTGRLDRDNAPGLPWVDGIERVDLGSYRSEHTRVAVVEADPECSEECSADADPATPHDDGCPMVESSPVTREQSNALEQAVRDALHDAWQSGVQECEYRTSKKRAREDIEANGHEFTEDGALYA